MSEALRLAEELDEGEWIATTNQWREEAAAELRRLHALVEEDSILQRRQRDEIAQLGQALARSIERINELEAELHEQARVNGMGSEREAQLVTDLEHERMRLFACSVVALADTPESAKSARQMHADYQSVACADVARRVDECIALRALNAELVEALHQIRAHTLYSPTGVVHLIARAALAKVEASK